MKIETSLEQLPNGTWRAVVFELDEDGARSVAAISECSTQEAAQRSAQEWIKDCGYGEAEVVAILADVTLPADHKIELKPFTQHDWYGWAGCVSFPNGDGPLIATSDLGILVVDAQGVGLYVGDGDRETDCYFWVYKFASAAQARIWVSGLLVVFAGANTCEDLDALAKEAGFVPN